MKQHKAFSEALILSSYFDDNGAESLAEVVKRFNDPFPMVNVYQHCTRHMKGKIHRWRQIFKLEERSLEMKKKDRAAEILRDTMTVVDSPVVSQGEHVNALDEFIEQGRKKVASGQMPITAQTYVQALKAKAEIENKQKDRRYDALKSLFGGAAPKSKDETSHM
jgi:hypothetical protein